MSFHDVIERQIRHSLKAFGPHFRWQGILDHIRKETAEVERTPRDLAEWIDGAILFTDGGTRLIRDNLPFLDNDDIVEIWEKAYETKVLENEEREWPDWRTADPNKAIEHVREPKRCNDCGEEVVWCKCAAEMPFSSAALAAGLPIKQTDDRYELPVEDLASTLGAPHGVPVYSGESGKTHIPTHYHKSVISPGARCSVCGIQA